MRLLFWVAVLACSMTALASAGPPYETDDPDPTQYRNYEIYYYGDYHRVGENINGSISTLEFNYGLFPNTQFSFDIPGAFSPTPQGTQYGLGDIGIGLKYRFVAETAGRPQISFYPSITLATGDPRNGLGEGRGTLFLPLWVQKSYGAWTIFGGAGLQLDREGSTQASWHEGIAIARDFGETTNIGVEVYHQTPDGVAQPSYTDLGVGYIHDIGKYHAFLFSFGRALAPQSLHGYAAYEWRLGPSGATSGDAGP